ncbi:tetraspanin-4-like [Galendromus occidentalis]|uniref:Tetraspanin n=1 Tax=Galendromus occidentalis TaxID=34638 RepID=A0AAJ7L6E0_9ACAR|nr:tetraspanin-4-like [Galendromus occidentalis]
MGIVQKLKRKFWYTRMLEGCGRLVKSALLVTNLLILIGGIIILFVGVWTLADRSFMARLLGSDLYVSSASILVATGSLVTVVSFMGCIGAFKEIKCLLFTFFGILLMIFAVLLVGGILGYVFRNEVGERMYQEMVMTIPAYGNDTAVTRAWDAVQQHFKCCGVLSQIPNDKPYQIWLQNIYFNDRKQVPESCCVRKDYIPECQASPSEASTYMDNCHTKVRDFVEAHSETLAGVGLAVATLILLAMILSCSMAVMIQ